MEQPSKRAQNAPEIELENLLRSIVRRNTPAKQHRRDMKLILAGIAFGVISATLYATTNKLNCLILSLFNTFCV